MDTMDKWKLAQRVDKGRHVVVLRGVSGSGKSTLADFLYRTLEGGAEIVSADQFFVDETGRYEFDGKRLGEAHAACLRGFVEALSESEEEQNALVIVDNTNTTMIEAAPYMALAAAYGFEATLVTLDTPAHVAAPRNVHGVDKQTVGTQEWRLQSDTPLIPRFWSAVSLQTGWERAKRTQGEG